MILFWILLFLPSLYKLFCSLFLFDIREGCPTTISDKTVFWRISLFFCQTRICNCNWYIIYKIISRRIWSVFSYPELTIWRIDSYKGTLIRSIVCQISSPVCSVSPSFAQFVSFMFLSGLRSSQLVPFPSNYNPGRIKSLAVLAKLEFVWIN